MTLLSAKDIKARLGINEKAAYKLVDKLNKELEEKGYLTIPHKVPEKYLEERFYG